MILCDFNMIVISNLMAYTNYNPTQKLDADLIRHVTLNSIRAYNKQFRSKYGDLVLCCDSRNYWRKGIFPYYKITRKKNREKSPYDWKFIFNTLSELRREITEFMPYRVVEVDGAEADDVIATLARRYCDKEDILILSSDKDFVQLQKYAGVSQYNPTLKRFVSTEDPGAFLKEHIMRGDVGDGIPNFLSPDNCISIGERQKRLNSKKLSEWITQDPEEFCNDEMLKNYKRNQILVDLDYIPASLATQIEEEYRKTKPASRMTMLNYFMDKDLSALMEVMDEF